MAGSTASENAPLGTRRTRQREALVELLENSAGPLSVPELLEKVNAGEETVGIATVYRTLKLLTESDRIRAVTFADGTVRYERAELGHHHHFHCRSCDKVFDLEGCPFHLHAEGLPQGYVVESHEITFQGLCPDCSASAKRRRKG